MLLGDRDHDAALRLAEQRGDRVQVVVEVHVGAESPCYAALGERHRDAAFRAVVGALDIAGADACDDGVLHVALELEVEHGRAAGDEAVLHLEVLAAAQFLGRLTHEHDTSPSSLNAAVQWNSTSS